MALVGDELETLVSEPDALTTRPPMCLCYCHCMMYKPILNLIFCLNSYFVNNFLFVT